jgi:hypothetical protein
LLGKAEFRLAAEGGFHRCGAASGPEGASQAAEGGFQGGLKATFLPRRLRSGVSSVGEGLTRAVARVAGGSLLAVALAACSQLPGFMQSTPEPVPPPAQLQLKPIQVVQRVGKFGYCTDCPAVTPKRVFLAVNANSDDAAERALARLRDALTKRGNGGKPGTGPLIEQIEPAAAAMTPKSGSKSQQRWVIFALLGDPGDHGMQKALAGVVTEFKGSSFHLLAEPGQEPQMAAFRGLLRSSGIGDGSMTSSIVQAEHRIDAAVAAPGTDGRGAATKTKMLVIRD